MSDKTKKRRFNDLDEKLAVVGMFLGLFACIASDPLEENQSVLDAWHLERTPMRDQTLRTLGLNLTALKKTLPKTSTANTAILKHGTIGKDYLSLENGHFYLLLGITNVEAANAFGLTPLAIGKAKADTSEKKEFSQLSTPPTPRNKMRDQRQYLDEYFQSIEPVSGIPFTLTYSGISFSCV